MISASEVLESILNDSCSSPAPDGFNRYEIELHCSTWEIEAMPVYDADGIYTGRFIIRSYKRTDDFGSCPKDKALNSGGAK